MDYTFYHDETNNIRKLYTGAGGFNVENLQIFVLGGVVHRGPPRSFDFPGLRKALYVQENVKDVKLKHVVQGGFLKILNSPNLGNFLRWLSQNDLILQYHNVDPFFWSIVDIIDSILVERESDFLYGLAPALKSDLTEVLRCDVAATARLFHQYGYPGLKPENRKPFIGDLMILLERYRNALPTDRAKFLLSVVREGENVDELPFIEGEPENKLIDNFAHFYAARFKDFETSYHIVDEENAISDQFDIWSSRFGIEIPKNFRFSASHNETGLQISDIAVGLIGKMYSYFTETLPKKLVLDREGLGAVGQENRKLLRDHISLSHSESPILLHHVISHHDWQKLDMFLQFPDGAYAAK